LTINVEIFGQLLPGTPRQRILETERPITVRQVAILLGLDPQSIGLISINGIQSEMEDPVPADCRLCFFPFLSGG
jgi:hypothetical protein